MKFRPALSALRFPSWLILAMAAALILLQQFVELPGNNMLLLALNNAAHTPFFAVLTLVLWQLHPLLPSHFALKSKLLVLAAAMTTLAVVTEVAQMFTARDASLQDLLRNMLGIGAAFCFIVVWQFRHQSGVGKRVALGLIGLLLIAYGFRDVIGVAERYQQRAAALPHLLVMKEDYLRRMARRFGSWRLGEKGDFYEASGRAMPADPDRAALLLLLEQGNYPGLALREPYPDWRRYQWLTIEAESLDDAPLALTVRVETARDRGHENSLEVMLSNVPTTLRLPLDSLVKGPAGERGDIRALLLSANGRWHPRGALIYDIRLEH